MVIELICHPCPVSSLISRCIITETLFVPPNARPVLYGRREDEKYLAFEASSQAVRTPLSSRPLRWLCDIGSNVPRVTGHQSVFWCRP
jgi:hypothetical protein